jgi:hypothetical protein
LKYPKGKFIVKFDSRCEDMATEVKTLLHLRKIQKKIYGPESSGLIPKIVEFGMVLIKE